VSAHLKCRYGFEMARCGRRGFYRTPKATRDQPFGQGWQGPPESSGRGMQEERRRSTGEAPAAPEGPGRRRSIVRGKARRRRRGSRIAHILSGGERPPHGGGRDGSTPPGKDTHPGPVGPDEHKPTSLRARANRVRAGDGSALRGSKCNRETGGGKTARPGLHGECWVTGVPTVALPKSKVAGMSIYIEINIRAPMDELWAKTQTPSLHERWDLRFTRIEYLPRPDDAQSQRFLYSTRIGFGLNIIGEGETVGKRDNKDGSRTSALKFWSDDSKSLIREGSGYWKYIPTENGIRFLTWYDYSTRFGAVGRAFDAVIFRPLMRWATAWSFDRLRLWLEKEIDPSLALHLSIIYGLSRLIVAFVWIYQGLVPKLIFRHRDEIAMLVAAGIQSDNVLSALRCIGWAEIAFGLLFLTAWRAGSLFLMNIVFMFCALIAVAVNSPQYTIAAFNPVTLNLTMIALSLIGYVSGKALPSAKRCIKKKPETAL
jgi:DoxX-like family